MSGSVVSLEAHGTAAIIQGSTSAMEPVTAVVTVMGTGDVVGAGTETGTGDGAPLPTVGKHSGGAIGEAEAWVRAWVLIGFVVVGWLGVWL